MPIEMPLTAHPNALSAAAEKTWNVWIQLKASDIRKYFWRLIRKNARDLDDAKPANPYENNPPW